MEPTTSSTTSNLSIDDDNIKDSKPKVVVPMVAPEVRKSMLELARKSILHEAHNSKITIETTNIRPKEKTIEATYNLSEGMEDMLDEEIISSTPDFETYKKLLLKGKVFSPFYQSLVIGFLSGLLQRLLLLMELPEASKVIDSNNDLEKILDEQELIAKKKLLAAANLVHYSLFHPTKVSKFSIEAAWLKDILAATLYDIEEKGTSDKIIQVIEEAERRENKLYEAQRNTKILKDKVEMIKVLIKTESEAHKETIREWAKSLTLHKNELKEIQKQQIIAYKYKADNALATSDCTRRAHEMQLVDARAKNIRFKANAEREKVVHLGMMEYMQKQNIALREEVLDLTSNHENDVQCLVWCVENIENQIKEKKILIKDIEPIYIKEMAGIAVVKAEAIRKQEEFYANQGKMELSLKSATMIQRIWQGYLVRKIYRKMLKKLKKKRLAEAKQKKKKKKKKKK